jgi:protocatechuate 3,4-dioxygenase beta subunit
VPTQAAPVGLADQGVDLPSKTVRSLADPLAPAALTSLYTNSATGQISGQVTWHIGGQDIALTADAGYLRLWRQTAGAWQEADVTYPDQTGTYQFADLSWGDYAVEFVSQSPDRWGQFSGLVNTNTVVDPRVRIITVTPDNPTDQINFSPATRISGLPTIKGEVLTGGEDVGSSLPIRALVTGADGRWALQTSFEATVWSNWNFAGQLPPGLYRLAVNKGRVSGWVDITVDVLGLPDADRVLLPVIVSPLPTISGRVGVPAEFMADLRVSAYSQANDFAVAVKTVDVDSSDGQYVLPVPPGAYRVVFTSRNSRVVTQVYNGVRLTGPVAEATEATLVEVSEQQQPTDINAILSVIPDVSQATKVITGQVVTADAAAVANGATVRLYRWQSNEWFEQATTLTDSTGSYRFTVNMPSGSLATLSASLAGYTTTYLGDTLTQPAVADSAGVATVGLTGMHVPTISLQVHNPVLGKVAGQDYDFCRSKQLPASDDGYSDVVDLPFAINFYGQTYGQAYVNNNGNITFTEPQPDFTPSDLDGGVDYPVIAPFFADVDTRGYDSLAVTFGSSPDGRQFCVNWAEVGYFNARSDRLNTFQLILSKPSTSAKRSIGDFDIIFNYDEIRWEAGQSSGGLGGLGGKAAAVGWTLGTQTAGTSVQLAGSLTPGALLDNGPYALVGHELNSGKLGRYIWEIRNGDSPVSFGNLVGRVVDASGQPIAGAYIEAQLAAFGGNTITDNDGRYTLGGLRAANHLLRVDPPAGYSLRPASTHVAVAAGQTTEVAEIALHQARGLPEEVTVTNGDVPASETADGVPLVDYREPITVSVASACQAGQGAYQLSLHGNTVREGALLQSSSNTYLATIAPIFPAGGNGEIRYTITCDTGSSQTGGFDVYVRPSSLVVNQYGDPIVGATVTLLRSPTLDGVYEAPDAGAWVLSTSTPNNPQVTGSGGAFGWDAHFGWYKVQVHAPGVLPAVFGPYQVAPARTGLIMVVQVASAQPSPPLSQPQILGNVAACQRLSLDSGVWAGEVTVEEVTWRAGNTVLGSAWAVDVPPDAAGQMITASLRLVRQQIGNLDGISDNDGGQAIAQQFAFNHTVIGGVAGTGSCPSPPASSLPDQTITASQAAPKARTVVKVKAGQTAVTLLKGRSITIKGAAYLSDGSRTTVTYRSAKPKIAKVSQTGKITGLRTGKTSIVLTAPGGRIAKLQVIVLARAKLAGQAKTLSVSGFSKALKIGEVRSLTSTIKPSRAAGLRVSYASTNRAVVQIDQWGRLVARQAGTAYITIKAGRLSRRAKVTVTAP